jgi:transcriptional regulator
MSGENELNIPESNVIIQPPTPQAKEEKKERRGGWDHHPNGRPRGGRLPKHPNGVAWNGRWQRILLLVEKGKTDQEIADALGMSPHSIYAIRHDSRFIVKQAEFELKATEKARKLFEDNAVAAAEKIVKLSKDGKPEERIQLDAAKEVIYLVGLKPVEVIETRKREYTQEELESALKVAQELEKITTRLKGEESPFVLKTEAPSLAPVTESLPEQDKSE